MASLKGRLEITNARATVNVIPENRPKQRSGNDLTKHPQPLPHPSKQRENPTILKAPKYWEGGGTYIENSQLQ